eukprot:jgi/Mesvir1/11284/Mv01078-RA.1
MGGDTRASLYQRFFAHAMATGMDGYETKLQPYKRRLFAQIPGRGDASVRPGGTSNRATPGQSAAAAVALAVGASSDFVTGRGEGQPTPTLNDAKTAGRDPDTIMTRALWWDESAGAAADGDSGRRGAAGTNGDATRGGPLDILEIGIGAGPNLGYYAGSLGGARVTGLDPNPAMEEYARRAAAAAGVAQLDFVCGVSERIPLTDASVDVVVGTLVMCSVGDAAASLQEIRRVLRTNGRYFFIEHVAAPRDRTWARLGQNVLTPLQTVLADGCHLNRETLKSISAAGFSFVDALEFDIADLGLLSSHVAGIAYA